MKDLVLATNNPGKLREFAQMLGPLDWRVVPQGEFGIGEIEEPHPTFVENALAKARHAATLAGGPALADDSGICVPLLGGAPGVRSARYSGEPKDDTRNNIMLVAALERHAGSRADWDAFYVAVLVLVRHRDDPLPLIAEGRWYGRVIAQPRGTGGFGYDPHFLVPDLNLTAAEMSADQKHARSHRGQALRALAAQLERADVPRV